MDYGRRNKKAGRDRLSTKTAWHWILKQSLLLRKTDGKTTTIITDNFSSRNLLWKDELFGISWGLRSHHYLYILFVQNHCPLLRPSNSSTVHFLPQHREEKSIKQNRLIPETIIVSYCHKFPVLKNYIKTRLVFECGSVVKFHIRKPHPKLP